ncbi:MAG: hypothetical protein ACR2MG_20655 [Pyrinomonadaceae bacterium]
MLTNKKIALKFCILIVTILSFDQFVYPQKYDLFQKYLSGKKKINEIKDIKTKNDFNQDSLTTEEIDNRIKKFLDNSMTKDIDIPINLGKLEYRGRKNPKDVINFDVASFELNMPMINTELEIFNFDGIWILVPDKTPKSYLNVFFAARAIQILKWRYPEAYTYLIKPNQNQKTAGLNINRLNPSALQPNLTNFVPIISFDKSPKKIAGSLWNRKFANDPTIDYGTVKVYENTVNGLVSINYETDRPKEIYGFTDNLKNYWSYLREGLVESITHEFTHLYIFNFMDLDRKANYIFKKRSDQTDLTFAFDAEEGIVVNTTQTYFRKKGGLSKTLIDFNMNKYLDKKKVLSDMSDEKNKVRFDNLKSLSPTTSTTFDEVYRLDLY